MNQGTPSLNRAFLFGGIGVAVIGLAVLASTFLSYRGEVERQARLLPAKGVVIDQGERSSGTRRRVVLTVRFITGTGAAVHFQQTYEPGQTGQPVKGDTVTVLYDPARPTRAEVEDKSWVGYAIGAGVGLGFVLVGAVLAARAIRDWRAAVARRAGTHAS